MILSKTINLMAFFETCRKTLSKGLIKLEIDFSSDDFFADKDITTNNHAVLFINWRWHQNVEEKQSKIARALRVYFFNSKQTSF